MPLSTNQKYSFCGMDVSSSVSIWSSCNLVHSIRFGHLAYKARDLVIETHQIFHILHFNSPIAKRFAGKRFSTDQSCGFFAIGNRISGHCLLTRKYDICGLT